MRKGWTLLQHRRTAGILAAFSILVLLFGITSASSELWAKKKKMKPEELVAKHLDSIGTAEARSAVTSRVILGECLMSLRVGGSGQLAGGLRIASAGVKNLIDMQFDFNQYPHERMAFDGKKVTVGQLKPGVRSPLARFLYTHEVLLKQGLIGGTLSTAWPLLHMKERNPKLRYSGIKKVEGHRYHELRYTPRKGSRDVRVRLYFEPETFRHVMSQYRLTISARMGSSPSESSQQRETRFKFVEEFSEFGPEGGLTLPHTYKMQLTIESQRSILFDWVMNMTEFHNNQPLSPGEFNVAN